MFSNTAETAKSFVFLKRMLLPIAFSGEPKNSAYVPAHVENGKLIPGMVK